MRINTINHFSYKTDLLVPEDKRQEQAQFP